MKKTMKEVLRKTVTVLVLILFAINLSAQKGKLEKILTPDLQNRIKATLLPLVNQLEKMYKEDKTGTYARYSAEIKKWKVAKDPAANREWTARITQQYGQFFSDIWSKARVDEKLYQNRIRGLFPDAIRKDLKFQAYLNFTITETTAIPQNTVPATDPKPENKCIDVCPLATGVVTSQNVLLGGGTGDAGNCFLKSTGWASGLMGVGDNTTILHNNISIPGTFPQDSRMLHVRISYFLKQEASSFAVLGCSIAYTKHLTYASLEETTSISPGIFVNNIVNAKQITEEYLIPKSEISNMTFTAYTNIVSDLIAGGWCSTECSGIKWTVCEE